MSTEQQAPARRAPFGAFSRHFYLAAVVLLIAAMIPVATLPMQGLKLALFAALALIAFLLSLGSPVWSTGRAALRGTAWIFLLPAAYLVSYFASVDRTVAFMGFGLETDTLLVVSLAVAGFLLSAAFFSSARGLRSLLTVVTWTLGIAAIFQGIVLLSGGLVLPDIFNDRSVNILGKWNDFGLLAGLLGLLLLARGSSWRVYLGAAGLALLLLFVNFPTAWYLLAASAVLWWLVRYMSGMTAHGISRWVPLGVVVVSIAFVLLGSSINSALSRAIPVSSLEVRPSFSSTVAVANSSHDSFVRTLVGTGPNTFGESWLLHKPAEVNNSLFWNLDFLVGFSAAATAFASVGLLGVLGWLMPLILIIFLAWRLRSRGAAHELSTAHASDALAVSLAAAYLFLALLIYVPSQSVVVFAFVLAGAAYGALRVLLGSVPRAWPRAMGIGFLAASTLALLFIAVNTGRFAVAQTQTNRGAQALTEGKLDEAIALARASNSITPNGNALRLALDANVQKVRALLETGDQAQVEANLATTMAPAVIAGQAAIVENPRDYRPLVSLGGLYGMLASVGVQQAYENSRDIFQGAALLNPTSPAIPLALARLEAVRGNSAGVASYLSQALQLKPNYTDAILLDVQLKVASEDLQGAIQSAQAAALTAPTAPAIWFQLGLLHYAAAEYQDASLALEQAIALLPTYANAKYFLGLSYYELDKKTEASALFDELSRTNPDNAEVKLISQNLQAGKAPLSGIASSTENLPTSAPIAE